MRSSSRSVVAGAFVVLVGCGSAPVEEPLARIDLRVATGHAEVTPVGITIDPTGTRYLFDENAGLYRLGADRIATMVLPLADLPVSSIPIQYPFTDLVALGPDRFALTAIGDGFLLDTTADTLDQYFCYVPDGLPEVLDQRTDALAYDPVTDQIYAQPRTYDVGGNLQWSEIATYQRDTGADLAWYTVDNAVVATGMTVIPGRPGELVLGQGDELTRFDVATGLVSELDELARFGIESIDGLAIDPVAHTLLVVDSVTDQLVEIELAELGL